MHQEDVCNAHEFAGVLLRSPARKARPSLDNLDDQPFLRERRETMTDVQKESMTTNEMIATQFVYQLADERIHIKNIHTGEKQFALNAADAWALLDFLYRHRDELYRIIHTDNVGKDPEVGHYPDQIEKLLTDLDERRPF